MFNNRGVTLLLEGEAQDYVGKGMYGGEIVVKPGPGVREPHRNAILGNTVLYGATGGSLYASGRAGERLCVRNSGALAVVEGCGDHGCEYMTGGVAVVLGATGRNFGAGMSGGAAFVWDEGEGFAAHLNGGMVGLERVRDDLDEKLLRTMVERHLALTGSPRARALLGAWPQAFPLFWKVAPHPERKEEAAEPGARLLERMALEAVLAEATRASPPSRPM